MGQCIYCGRHGKMTGEHIYSKSIYPILFPNGHFRIIDNKIIKNNQQEIRDVCGDCNNKHINYTDQAAKEILLQIHKNNTIITYDFNNWILKSVMNHLRTRNVSRGFAEYTKNSGIYNQIRYRITSGVHNYSLSISRLNDKSIQSPTLSIKTYPIRIDNRELYFIQFCIQPIMFYILITHEGFQEHLMKDTGLLMNRRFDLFHNEIPSPPYLINQYTQIIDYSLYERDYELTEEDRDALKHDPNIELISHINLNKTSRAENSDSQKEGTQNEQTSPRI